MLGPSYLMPQECVLLSPRLTFAELSTSPLCASWAGLSGQACRPALLPGALGSTHAGFPSLPLFPLCVWTTSGHCRSPRVLPHRAFLHRPCQHCLVDSPSLSDGCHMLLLQPCPPPPVLHSATWTICGAEVRRGHLPAQNFNDSNYLWQNANFPAIFFGSFIFLVLFFWGVFCSVLFLFFSYRLLSILFCIGFWYTA